MGLDFQGLNRFLLGRSREIVSDLLPGGELIGNEYTCADLRGGAGRSLKVNIVSGLWSDFATGDKGGDLVSLAAAAQSLDQCMAYTFLSETYGYTNGHGNGSNGTSNVHVESAKVSLAQHGTELVPPPLDVEPPKFTGKVWPYPDFDGRVLIYIERVDKVDKEGKPDKDYYPRSWSSVENKWVKKAWKTNRPIYGLDLLAADLVKPVLIVEGEKAADAARHVIKNYAVITWSGGANASLKTDWAPIYGRAKVLLWPDADKAGIEAMDNLAKHLAGKVGEIKIFDVSDQPVTEGWDAADAFMVDGWDYKKWTEWAKPRAKLYDAPPVVDLVPMPVVSDLPPGTNGNIEDLSEPIDLPKWVQSEDFVSYYNEPLSLLAAIPPIPIKFYETTNDAGKTVKKVKAPTQPEVALHIANFLSGSTARYDKDDVFTYNGTHWVEWEEKDHAELLNTIIKVRKYEPALSTLTSIKKLILSFLPFFDKNPFILNPFFVNFMDGTLEINRGADGKYTKVFREHRKADMCLSTIPLAYNADRSVDNLEFGNMIARVTNYDVAKIRMVQQMYGAMLAPVFPHFWFLEGGGGTGKSTVILGASYLRALNAEDLKTGGLSMVSPDTFKERFAKEAMVGCLVNFVLDIPIHSPIDDSVVKQVEDRVPMYVDRKNKKATFVPIPAVHIYGCNSLPPTLEWGSNAMARRVTVIKFNKFNAEVDGYTRDFARQAFDSCPAGVLNFALEGLDDLLASDGLYYSSDESKERVDDWQIEKAPAALFLKMLLTGDKAIDAPEVPGEVYRNLIFIDPNKTKLAECISRSRLWKFFCAWHRDCYNRTPKIGRNAFFKALERTAVFKPEMNTNGIMAIRGIIETADIKKEQQLHLETAVHLNP